MNILVTGAKGFIGKNLCVTLRNINEGKDKSFSIQPPLNIFEYDIDTNPSLLDEYCSKADFVFNLAGVNRPKDEEEFMSGNYGFASTLLECLRKHKNKCPVMLASSIQATQDNPYGRSKKAGEDLFFKYAKETGARVLIYRFPNVFGKWCRPNYNSAIATFCHNIARGLPITVNDDNVIMKLVYIDDVITELINALIGKETRKGDFFEVKITYTITLGEIVKLILSFKSNREEKTVPDMSDDFTRKLYATYLSYLPFDQFNYPLKMNIDGSGSFTEIIRTNDRGQFSVNIIKPGVVKGNHWHHSKNEKFLVVSGMGVIRLRRVDSEEVIEYYVDGEKLEVIDIPPGYTHNIENLGDTDLITFMWASECFNPEKTDTFYEIV
ncbi:MAG: capsular polysaccharide biosynthesis protein CapF [Clostridiaceae bacterium]|nr:capsular polysaccharide biosynthesis protein CapF [Clostridiaceae bacterium]